MKFLKNRHIVAALTAASVAMPPAQASANDAAALIGGAIIGAAIANGSKNKRVVRRTTGGTKRYKSSANSAARQENRETQTALNYFGFDAGGADGVMGRRSRAAVTAFQAHLGYPPTGQLTVYERNFLMSAYHRAQAGGPAVAQLAASNPLGMRGVLLTWRDEAGAGMPGVQSAAVSQWGLPPVVAQSVHEIARSSDPTADQLVQRSGFIQLADMNGDGRTDYILDTSVSGSAFWCSAQACAVRVFASTPQGYERNDFQAYNVTPAMFSCQHGVCSKSDETGTQMAAAPVTTAPALPQTQTASAQVSLQAATPVAPAQPVVQGGAPVEAAAATGGAAMPDFFAAAPMAASLESHCNEVGLQTSTNGGYITAATLVDADQALGQQLCLARTYAIAQGEELVAKLPAAAQSSVGEQCEGFGALLKPHVAAASVKPADAVLSDVGAFVLQSGLPPAQMEKTSVVCLGVGYKMDDLDTALGSALVLVALGKQPYAELVGHHLSQGYGTPDRDDLAGVWYTRAIDALEGGTAAVFNPGQPGRTELLRKAVMLKGGQGAAQAEESVTVVPIFNIAD
ncbi:peptidoglycan-binding domain-containing protein [Vannielia sp. SX4]|uniref:peptidoglycan-binding domain-containing protein n=1 Tax=Vannielia sp. SX4 TaxID=3463852 RepID=UPI0040591D54